MSEGGGRPRAVPWQRGRGPSWSMGHTNENKAATEAASSGLPRVWDICKTGARQRVSDRFRIQNQRVPEDPFQAVGPQDASPHGGISHRSHCTSSGPAEEPALRACPRLAHWAESSQHRSAQGSHLHLTDAASRGTARCFRTRGCPGLEPGPEPKSGETPAIVSAPVSPL